MKQKLTLFTIITGVIAIAMFAAGQTTLKQPSVLNLPSIQHILFLQIALVLTSLYMVLT